MSDKKEPETPPPKKSFGIKRFFRRAYRMVSSHLGLIILLTLFSFLGAVIFEKIEGPEEEVLKQDIIDLRDDIIDGMWNTSEAIKRNEAAFKQLLKRKLRDYEAQLYSVFGHGINTDSEKKVWDFWGAFFYSATIYSTIGYGHIAPSTTPGKICTMIYATLGIPLCLIVMADLGKLFTKALKYIWAIIRTMYHNRKNNATAPETSNLADNYVINDEFNLPVAVAIAVTIVYIFLGALLYIQWENWSYLDAFYFVFISVSTIGFGDVLPEHPKFFLASSVYILVGLALVSMVINVIMETMDSSISKATAKMVEVSKTIGISLEDVEEEEGDIASKKN